MLLVSGLLHYFRINKINPIMRSFSFGLLSATRSVSEVSASGFMRKGLSKPVFFRNQTKAKAPERLLPSING